MHHGKPGSPPRPAVHSRACDDLAEICNARIAPRCAGPQGDSLMQLLPHWTSQGWFYDGLWCRDPGRVRPQLACFGDNHARRCAKCGGGKCEFICTGYPWTEAQESSQELCRAKADKWSLMMLLVCPLLTGIHANYDMTSHRQTEDVSVINTK